MKKIIKVLAAGCLCVSFAGTVTAHAEAEKSQHITVLVTAPADYANIAVSQVTDYVNIREQANTGSNIVGKIYNNCAATILETVEGEGGQWYRIQSGTVNGYIKAQYFITGQEAEALAQSIGREFATINTESLRLREKPDLSSNTLTLLSQGARYVVQGEEGDFFRVEIDTDMVGYIAQSYCRAEVEFDQAVSLAEEQQKLAEEAQRKQAADQAIANLEQVKQVEAKREAEGTRADGAGASAGSSAGTSSGASASAPVDTSQLIIEANPLQSDNSQQATAPALASADTRQPASTGGGTGGGNTGGSNTGGSAGGSGSVSGISSEGPSGGAVASPAAGTSSGGSSGGSNVLLASGGPGSAAVTSAARTAIVAYARQFLGNPYVYGGTSLTDGADCSGFTQGIFAHFGITTGRSSRDQAAKGKEIAVSSAQAGDLLFYASGEYINHVALYIGDGKVIHSSNPTTGIIISPYNYRTPCKAVTFLD